MKALCPGGNCDSTGNDEFDLAGGYEAKIVAKQAEKAAEAGGGAAKKGIGKTDVVSVLGSETKYVGFVRTLRDLKDGADATPLGSYRKLLARALGSGEACAALGVGDCSLPREQREGLARVIDQLA